MFHTINASNADEAWKAAVELLLDRSMSRVQDSRQGMTYEIPRFAFSISDPRQRWTVSRSPSLNIAFAMAEVIWIVTGRNDSKFLNYFNRQLPKYAGSTANYPGAYGHRLRRHLGVDQLERASCALVKNGRSRQVVLQIWDGQTDFPLHDGTAAHADIPCNVVSMLKIRDDRLEWTQVVRSNDVFRGLPYNLIQFTSLQEILAGWIGIEVGCYSHIADSLHVYEPDITAVSECVAVHSEDNNDRLALPYNESHRVFDELGRLVDAIVEKRIQVPKMISLVAQSSLPTAYRNMLTILFSESARRSSCKDEADELLSLCTNPVLRQLQSRWFERFSIVRSM